MIRLRSFRDEDVLKLDELWRLYWSSHSFPDRENRIIDAIAVNEFDKIVGYGQVKMFAEAMLFLDPTSTKRDKAHALKSLMLEAYRGCSVAGVDEMYAFIQNPDFLKLIVNRFGFKHIENPGQLLLRKL